MASVERRVRDGKVTWQARWRDPEGAQRKRTFTKKGDADRFASVVEADKLRGLYIDPTDRTTVLEYARTWAAMRSHRPATAARVRSLIDTHLAGTALGDRRISAVRPSEVQAWATDRASVLAPSTLRLLVGLLRSVCASAVLDRLIPTTPVTRVSLPRCERERVIPLTVPQVRSLADAMPDRCRAMVVVQAGLGLRLGELLALRVQDVDFLHRAVRVEGQIVARTGERAAPKTPRSRRALPLPSVVADALAQHIVAYPPGADGSLFTSSAGGPALGHRGYGYRIFRRAVREAGLPEGTSSHDLRHHYASVLIEAGESVVGVAERLGHENAALVLSTYAHLMPDTEDRTRKAVDAAWRAPAVPPRTAKEG